MNNLIRLETLTDINTFHAKVSELPYDIYLTDGTRRYRVNAKSYLSCLMASGEWSSIHVECEEDIYSTLKPWIIEGVSMT